MATTKTISRRSFLRTPIAPAAAPVFFSGLAPYTGEWTDQEAGHLLARAALGTSYQMLKESTTLGLEATLDRLFEELDLPAPPVVTSSEDNQPIGITWVDKAYPEDTQEASRIRTIRAVSLHAWSANQLIESGFHAREMMALFWHNHFAINVVTDPRLSYRYVTTLRSQAFGNFRQLVKDITVDPLMLGFLNGSQNTLEAPNENYARELMELFTIGKGPQVGADDYTNYTEQDVVAFAKSLTGWRTVNRATSEGDDFGSSFFNNRHDSETVTLSHRFGNQTLASSGEDTYKDVVDLILAEDEVARYIVRKLYRWFVYYEITPEAEAEVIEPLATLFRDSDYQIKPTLRALLGSEHFFDILSQGPMIKHPIAFTLGMLQNFEVPTSQPNETDRQALGLALYRVLAQMEMAYFVLPNVAGWRAYYQEPLFYRDWINSATLPLRINLTNQLMNQGIQIRGINGRLETNLLAITNQFPEPGELWQMIGNWVSLLFPRPVPQAQLEFIRDVLLPGLPETQWAVEYADYLANPNDQEIANALDQSLRRMVLALTEMPEYQLS
jgi:uncharacterized protein (DUF1800 family)